MNQFFVLFFGVFEVIWGQIYFFKVNWGHVKNIFFIFRSFNNVVNSTLFFKKARRRKRRRLRPANRADHSRKKFFSSKLVRLYERQRHKRHWFSLNKISSLEIMISCYFYRCFFDLVFSCARNYSFIFYKSRVQAF